MHSKPNIKYTYAYVITKDAWDIIKILDLDVSFLQLLNSFLATTYLSTYLPINLPTYLPTYVPADLSALQQRK
jgi:hypothetical protein